MKLVLPGLRLAFPEIWVPKPNRDGKGEPSCHAQFILDPLRGKNESDAEFKKRKDALTQAAINVITEVAKEKWGAKAMDVLKTLKAKGDLCLHDGNTKAEYDGFPGNLFISARNAARPVVAAQAKHNGKTVTVSKEGRAFIDGEEIDPLQLAFTPKAPYSGCYVNVSLDVWAQDNQYGKRINAKLLAVQFSADGLAFSGGAAFDDADFEAFTPDTKGGDAQAADPWSSPSDDAGFGFGGESKDEGGFEFGGESKEESGFSF